MLAEVVFASSLQGLAHPFSLTPGEGVSALLIYSLTAPQSLSSARESHRIALEGFPLHGH
jgi:hypothetical protein